MLASLGRFLRSITSVADLPPTTEHRAKYTQFGNDGTAHVFINRTQLLPVVRWLWNR